MGESQEAEEVNLGVYRRVRTNWYIAIEHVQSLQEGQHQHVLLLSFSAHPCMCKCHLLGLADRCLAGIGRAAARNFNFGEHLDVEESSCSPPRRASPPSPRDIHSFDTSNMAQPGRYRFLAIAVVFHLIYIYRSACDMAGRRGNC